MTCVSYETNPSSLALWIVIEFGKSQPLHFDPVNRRQILKGSIFFAETFTVMCLAHNTTFLKILGRSNVLERR